MQVYLAGGAVRDLLQGRTITDRDYLVMDATKQEFKDAFPGAHEVGRAFPVFLLDGLEFSFPRATSITDELKARDLTVNALLLDEEGELACHPLGLHDLHNKILRPASRQSFIDDPLRVFRAARFWAKLPDFTPHDELIETMRYIAEQGLLKTLAPDRIGQETVKALNTPAPGNYLRLLAQADCLSPWFAEFKDSMNIPAGPLPYHDTSVIEHTCRVMDALAGDEYSVWMGLCHDLGKTRTPAHVLPKHHGHDKVGVQMADVLSKRLRLSNAHAHAGAKAAKWHMIAARYEELRPATKVDMLMDLHLAQMVTQLFSLVVADRGTDFSQEAMSDVHTIVPVRLPKELMNLGAESGKRLRELRAHALKNSNK